MYYILVHDGTKWQPTREEFGDPDSATTFADTEVGLPWIVVNEAWEPIEYGDVNGLHPERCGT